MEITVVVHQEGGSFWSEIDELPGCFASGRTLSELSDALSDAIGLYLDAELVPPGDRVLRPGRMTIEIEPST
jgi:predicted RNase H-like HicB family nuclease